ncbi:MAG: ABC transporter substrate-binding protein [Cellulosilyticaceae bacterium]
MGKLKKIASLGLTSALVLSTVLTGCGGKGNDTPKTSDTPKTTETATKTETPDVKDKGETVNLVWYQIGGPQKDMPTIVEKANAYIKEKINATIEVKQVDWGDYNQKMSVIINSGEAYDLAFTCSWANDYLANAQKGAFLALDELLPKYGKDMQASIDPKFWEAAKVGGVTYGVPNQKEIGSMPMWVFTKEYVDKYKIPYQDIHSLEDLEPWLKLIKEKEPDVVPLYGTKDYSAPAYFDKLVDPVGIEYGDDSLKVQNLFETEKMKNTLKTMRKYYEAGYINKDAATASDDKAIKRFVTKGDGQPYAEGIWSKDLGYPVVATPIMDTVVTNGSARGSLTAISATSKYPEKAMELLNLVNTDPYLRNLLNYGIEGVHYNKVNDTQIKLTEKAKDYSVPYWVMGDLFTTYVLESEPKDKWVEFKTFNQSSVEAPTFGFDFNATPVLTEIAGLRNVLDQFGSSLYTGSVDPDEYLPKLNEKLKATGVDKIIVEMQKQVDAWKANK